MFKNVNEAMVVLGDRDKRDEYDNEFDVDSEWAGYGFTGGVGDFRGMDLNDPYCMFMRF